MKTFDFHVYADKESQPKTKCSCWNYCYCGSIWSFTKHAKFAFLHFLIFCKHQQTLVSLSNMYFFKNVQSQNGRDLGTVSQKKLLFFFYCPNYLAPPPLPLIWTACITFFESQCDKTFGQGSPPPSPSPNWPRVHLDKIQKNSYFFSRDRPLGEHTLNYKMLANSMKTMSKCLPNVIQCHPNKNKRKSLRCLFILFYCQSFRYFIW